MQCLLAVVLMAASVASQPLEVSVSQERAALMVDFELNEDLPDPFFDALPTGALVRLSYQIQLRSDRRLMWDRRVWRGELAVTAVFDPVTGRYRCESVLDDVIVASEEFTEVERALAWLTHPPEVRLAMHDSQRWRKLRIRVRAVYATSTTWLVFPSTDGTEWVELRIESSPPPDGDSGPRPTEPESAESRSPGR